MPRANRTQWWPHRRYHRIPGGNDAQRYMERGRYPWHRSFFRSPFTEHDEFIEPSAWFAMIDDKKWRMQEWTQREIRKNIWNLVRLKKKPGSKGYRDIEDQIIMLNDILYDLHNITEDDTETLYPDHPVSGLIKPEVPFERLGQRAQYPHKAPQWIPSTSREDIRNRIQYYRKHPTRMRPYFGNGNYCNLNDMTYQPRIRKRTYKDYMYQLCKIAMEDVAPELANIGESTLQLGKLLQGSQRNYYYEFPYNSDAMKDGKLKLADSRLPGPAPLMSNIPRLMATEGDNDVHWLLPWSIWRTMRIMPLLSKLMTRGLELQWETYNPTPVEARAMVQSATMRVPRYRLGENIPWNKRIYHMYNNNHNRYGTKELRDMTAKWITRNVQPTKAVAEEKSYWSKYLQQLTNYVVSQGTNALVEG